MQRTTPHTTTGVLPLQLMLDRKIKDKLPRLSGGLSEVNLEWKIKEKAMKKKIEEDTNE